MKLFFILSTTLLSNEFKNMEFQVLRLGEAFGTNSVWASYFPVERLPFLTLSVLYLIVLSVWCGWAHFLSLHTLWSAPPSATF